MKELIMRKLSVYFFVLICLLSGIGQSCSNDDGDVSPTTNGNSNNQSGGDNSGDQSGGDNSDEADSIPTYSSQDIEYLFDTLKENSTVNFCYFKAGDIDYSKRIEYDEHYDPTTLNHGYLSYY